MKRVRLLSLAGNRLPDHNQPAAELDELLETQRVSLAHRTDIVVHKRSHKWKEIAKEFEAYSYGDPMYAAALTGAD